MIQTANTSKTNGNDEGGSIGGAAGLCCECKFLTVPWDDHTDKEDGQNVEEQDSVEGKLDSARYSAARILSLSDCHTDQLSSEIGEGCVDHYRPEAKEATCRPSCVLFLERARVFPVAETLAIAVGTTAEGKDQRQEDDTNDSDDLEGGQPELKFSEELDAEEVDDDNQDKKDRYPYTRIDTLSLDPILHYKGTGSELIGRDDDVFQPIPNVVSLLARSVCLAILTSSQARNRAKGRRNGRRNQ